jgi:hypothetical protein
MHATGGYMVVAQKHIEAEEVAHGTTYNTHTRD